MVSCVVAWIRYRARFRGSFLLLSGLAAVPYGTGILIASQSARKLAWWPGSLRSLAGLPLDFWGWLWIGVGAAVMATCWTVHDRAQFAAIIALNGLWTFFAINRGIHPPYDPGAWAPGSIYLGITAALILIASWPDPPELIPEQDRHP